MSSFQIKSLCDQAVALHQAGRLGEAERLYTQVRALDPGNFTANYLTGVIQHGRGEFAPALASMDKALASNPKAVNVLIYRGLLLEALGRDSEALAAYNEVLQLQPNMVEALVNRGNVLGRIGRPGHALADFESALSLKPDFVPALYNRGTMLQQLERHDEALAAFDQTLKRDPGHLGALGNRGAVLRALKRPNDALAAFDQVLARDPGNVMAHYNRGVALMDKGQTQDALAAFDRALALQPGFAMAHGNRATALTALGRGDEALAAYDRAPQDFTTLSERGELLHDLQRFPEALASYDAALAIKPDALVANNRGGVLQNMRRQDEARASYDAALRIDPGQPDALSNRAQLCWQHYKDYAAALGDFEKLLALDPYHDHAASHLLHMKLLMGDWSGYRDLLALVDAGVRQGKKSARPFIYQGLSPSPADLKMCSELYTARRYPPLAPMWRPRFHDKIRIGYVCGEFREQATTFLAAGLFERHDKSRFELFAFDNGWSDNSKMRERLEAAFDHFVPIADLGDEAAAREIASREIDILVSLNGYFGLGRMGVFARKPAPIQVNYLGFPATLGAPYMDYIVADRVVVPEDEARFYTEQVAWLPDSYQVNDDRRAIGPATTRAAHGLPQDAFLFCNFNHSYKILPEMWDSWMRILSAVPGSVLWLWDSNPNFAGNMRREAAARGVDPSRLIFSPTVGHAEHLARLQLADLAIDSLPYNAHTTGSDALWAGLPLLTCRGATFPGRVAASLLTAIGLPELITENLPGFEVKAIALAQDKEELARLRARLAENRATTPLYDTDRYRRNIEAAYQQMWDRFQRGDAPAGFAV